MLTLLSCQHSEATETSASKKISDNSPTSAPNLNSPIRKIDFKNFTYPWTEDLTSNDDKTFTLKDGETPFELGKQMGVLLGKVKYADLTNDGQDEALITISLQT